MNQNTIVPNIGQWKIKEEFNVLSEFDGMSCGQLALQMAGKKVTNYFASEIDKYAIQIANKNFPNTKQLGDVTKINISKLPKIHLFIGGSPCQGFSFAGKQLNFSDPRSKLFFEFAADLRFIQEFVNPEVKFFLENVKMKKEFQDVISRFLGVEPIEINSALISAQNRKRLYWTNIEGYIYPEDEGILLKDIVHEHTDFLNILTPNFNVNPSGKGMNGVVRSVNNDKSNTLTTNKGEGHKIYIPQNAKILIPEATKKGYIEAGVGDFVDLTFINSKTRRGRAMNDKSNCLTASPYEYCQIMDLSEYIVPFDKTLQILEKEVQRGKVGYFRKDSQANRIYYIHDKAVTLCGDAGGGAAKMGQYLFGEVKNTNIVHQAATDDKFGKQPRQQDRVYNIEAKAPALHLDSSRTKIAVPIGEVSEDYIFGCITPDRIDKRQNGQRFNDGTKFYTLTAQDKHGILIEGYIRKLTPIECERLQTVPDNYTEGVSNSQRYKMLGNGWTAKVIKTFFDAL